MMLATIEALKNIGGSASLDELDEKVVELNGVSEAEQQVTMPSDPRPKLNYYLAWSRTYLKRGEAIRNSSRGVWALTEVGRKIDKVSECKKIYDRVQAEERDKQRKKRLAKKASEPELNLSPEPEDVREDPGSWKQRLLSVVQDMHPNAFERLSQRLLREAGFTKVEVRGKTGDGGIDGLGVLRVNLVSFQVYFQCKRYKGSVPSSDIRDFRGALQGRADKGLFITTGNFTSQAGVVAKV